MSLAYDDDELFTGLRMSQQLRKHMMNFYRVEDVSTTIIIKIISEKYTKQKKFFFFEIQFNVLVLV